MINKKDIINVSESIIKLNGLKSKILDGKYSLKDNSDIKAIVSNITNVVNSLLNIYQFMINKYLDENIEIIPKLYDLKECIENNYYIRCKTEEQAKVLISKLYKMGYKWCGIFSDKLTTNWYNHTTFYTVEKKQKTILCIGMLPRDKISIDYSDIFEFIDINVYD